MALDISGIGNVGEFFSQHYLDALLEKDLKDTLARWAKRKLDDKLATPQESLARLADPYFRVAAKAEGTTSPTARLELSQSFHADLLSALGYERRPSTVLLDDDRVVPVLHAEQQNQKPWLWIVEAPFPLNADEADPFGESPLLVQVGSSAAGLTSDESLPALATESWRELFDGPIFRAESPPRWVIFVAGSDIFLLDRDKWHQGKYLHFQLGRLLGLRDPKALQATVGLLHREVLVPEGGQSLLEKLDEESHKHAFAVSTDLKLGAQKAIELLGNEAVRYRLEILKVKTYDDELDVRDLTRECITYLYRLLFLFYVEARGSELGVVPMSSDAYRLGYSLESLRDLELIPLTTDEARNGTYLSDSLRRLFHLIQRGHGRAQTAFDFSGGEESADASAVHATFELRGLRSPLFDEERTPILRAVKFKNQTVQEVLQLLSLSKEGKGKARGRISYAQLGINQLGAVYEGLLSYTGFFAGEELFEVRDEKEIDDESARTYFVPASKVDAYKKAELVKDEFNRPKKHAKGTFLFRLSGRDRERSASYYTPEVLTRCLTKYTLKVRLGEPLLPEDDTPELRAQRVSADEILKLTLCEPAMGSGAFLNEAVSQLAEKYLEKKQQELGKSIPAEQYQAELAKVKYHFVVHNTYGVDLNPLATELGKISLWLNVLQEGVEAPYLDQRLAVGNSLIGARREVFATHLLTARGSTSDTWLTAVPDRVPLRDPSAPLGEDLQFPARPKNTVYHFLLSDAGMVAYADDDVVNELRAEQAAHLHNWRKAQQQPFTDAEVTRLLALSDRIDAFWQTWAQERIERDLSLRQPIHIWGQPNNERAKWDKAKPEHRPRFRSVEECEDFVSGRRNQSGPALQLIMDYWCALWFWPVLDAQLTPTRDEWLGDVESILEGGAAFVRHASRGAPGAEAGRASRLAVVRRIAAEQRFFHWQLAFAEVFSLRGGIDLFLGNPPWIKVEWSEAGVLGDLDPQLNLRKLNASDVANRRRGVLSSEEAARVYLQELSSTQGQVAVFSSVAMFPGLRGIKSNLYKCFFETLWPYSSMAGITGLVHQPGIFDDPAGGTLREHFYSRARLVAMGQNQLKLFPDVNNGRPFAFSVTGPRRAPAFLCLANLFHPSVLDASVSHDGVGAVPGIKTPDGSWSVEGHRARVISIDPSALSTFAQMYDPPGTPEAQARLPVLHSTELLSVLQALQGSPRLGGSGLRWGTTREWNETDRTRDDTISVKNDYPRLIEDAIVGGPMLSVANPLYKEPNERCEHNKDYAVLDLTNLAAAYLPRCKYAPLVDAAEYRERLPLWNERPINSFYRHMHRLMLDPAGERTFVPAILPTGAMSIDAVFTAAFATVDELAQFSALASSLVVDFFVRSTGKGNARGELLETLPFPPRRLSQSINRVLRLNCLTVSYAELWHAVSTDDINTDGFTRADSRLQSWTHLTTRWTRDSALRTPYERRQALVELDALAALSLGLTVEQLLLIYRVQFPVLQQYERETFYDQRGKIVFTANRGLTGVGVARKEWEQIQRAQGGDKLPAFAKDAGGPFVPPFDSCDRETDMAQAYRYFQGRLAKGAVEELPTVIPSFSDTAEATYFIWAVLHALGGTAILADLARAFVLRARPGLMKRLAPGSLKGEVGHWVSTVGARSLKEGMLAPTLSTLKDRDGVRPGTDSEGRATVSTTSHTQAAEKLDPWFRFEAQLVTKVLRAQSEEERDTIDQSLSGAERKLLEGVG